MVDARPFKMAGSDADEYNCMKNPTKYFSNCVCVRDWIVGLYQVVSAILLLVGASHLLEEARVLKTDTVYNDGNYNRGLVGWHLFFSAFIISLVADVCALLLDIGACVRPSIKVWWPESEMRDIGCHITSFVCNLLACIFSMSIINIMRRDFGDIDDKTPHNIAAAKRTVGWQLFYGVERFGETPHDEHMMTVDTAIMGMLVVYTLRVVYILFAWFFVGEKPLYLFPFCCHRNNPIHKAVGAKEEPTEDGVTHTDSKKDEVYIAAPWGNCGGAFSEYVHNQLGAIHMHKHVYSILFFAGFLVLATHDTDKYNGYVPWPTEMTKGGFGAVSLTSRQCEYTNNSGLTTSAFAETTSGAVQMATTWITEDWTTCPIKQTYTAGRAQLATFPGGTTTQAEWKVLADAYNDMTTATTVPSKQITSCRNPSLYVVQDPGLFLGTMPVDHSHKCTRKDKTSGSDDPSEAKCNAATTKATCDAVVGTTVCHWQTGSTDAYTGAKASSSARAKKLAPTGDYGRWIQYRGLRMNQMRCFIAAKTTEPDPTLYGGTTSPTGSNGNGWPAWTGSGILDVTTGKYDTEAAFSCCPNDISLTELTDSNDVGTSMYTAASLFVAGAVLNLLAMLAYAFSMSAFGVSAVPSDVPRNTALPHLNPC